VGVVMDAVEFDKAVVMGISEGGSLAALFAAHHPDRCQGLVLYGAFASFKSWFPNEESLLLVRVFNSHTTANTSSKDCPNRWTSTW
jgi:pimeloyl-ACP methyl ester carboxylesterase